MNQPWAWLTAVLLGVGVGNLQGDQTATVKENHLNVRGQASLLGEVITQLQKGEPVVVLEEILVAKPKKDEPSKWSRIRMPANTPVWVHAPYIDPANKSVKVSRVNLRAGPGENYSVVGRLERGDTVKDIRTVEEWMEIETPVTAYAFVASELLVLASPLPASPALPTPALTTEAKLPSGPAPADMKAATNASPAEAASPKPTVLAETAKPIPELPPEKIAPIAPPTIVQAPPVEVPPALAVDVPAASPKPDTRTPALVVTEPKPAIPEPAVEKTTTPEKTAPTPTPASVPALTPVATAAAVITPKPTETGPPPKRIVRREGIVRATRSIQAPTYFELVHPETKKVINYLHTDEPTLKLKDFRGKKIVTTGEEGIDPRWPNIPLIEIQTLELAP